MKCISFTVFLIFLPLVLSFPDPGQWSTSYIKVDSAVFGVAKPLYSESSIFISINCEPYSTGQKIELQWVLRQISCFEDSLAAEIYSHPNLTEYFICPISTNYSPQVRYFISKPVVIECSNRIPIQFINVSFTTYTENSDIPDMCSNIPASKNLKLENNSKNYQSEIIIEANNTLLRKKRSAVENTNSNVGSKNHSKQISTKSNETTNVPGKVSVSFQKNEGNNAVNTAKNETTFKEHDFLSVPMSSPNQFKQGSKLATVDRDGIYLFLLRAKSLENGESKFNISVHVTMRGDYGFLSAVDYPLLIFYGVMCGLYVIYAIAWLVMSALQWRDLLRIQFWIGAVILLGLMEKAVFYAEYQSINFTGQSVQGAILFAEILSCMKRTLARMLIIIVSLGFGIVKPRLGPMLHRIIGVGALYFCLGTIEGCLRVLKPKTDPGNQALMAGIPLAVTDSAICWWIFSSLVQTIRTLRLRRNIVKLQLYKHFTNALMLSVIGSVVFMTWSIHAHKLVNCITDWKELWVDEAYWHFLFSVILFVIMILWRPTNNNQRYAFTPLLDAMDEDEEDDEENHLTNDAFVGMKMRTTKNNSSASPKHDDPKTKQDEDLKWVEENIPTSLTDVALPSLLDSDEEIMTAKFERSKME